MSDILTIGICCCSLVIGIVTGLLTKKATKIIAFIVAVVIVIVGLSLACLSLLGIIFVDLQKTMDLIYKSTKDVIVPTVVELIIPIVLEATNYLVAKFGLPFVFLAAGFLGGFVKG